MTDLGGRASLVITTPSAPPARARRHSCRAVLVGLAPAIEHAGPTGAADLGAVAVVGRRACGVGPIVAPTIHAGLRRARLGLLALGVEAAATFAGPEPQAVLVPSATKPLDAVAIVAVAGGGAATVAVLLTGIVAPRAVAETGGDAIAVVDARRWLSTLGTAGVAGL